MFKFILAVMASLALLASASSRAYTPESGYWYNPNESGSGLTIEINDNFIAILGYTYDDAGNPLWVGAQGFLDDNASFQSSNDPNDGSWLTIYTDGQCLGCPYTGGPTPYPGSAGRVSLIFDPDDPTKASFTWGGRTQPLQRFQFYLHRGSDGSAPIQVTKMLGEWQTVQDYADHPTYTGYPYYAEIIAFESIDYDSSSGNWLFEGCRTDDSLGAGCTEVTAGLYYHDAAGLYDDESGRNLIVVTDSRNNDGSSKNCVLYDVQVGTNDFSGGLDYEHDGVSGGFTLYPCGDDPFAYDFYPVRGYRSASRTYVQEGYGPSKHVDSGKASPAISDFVEPAMRPASKQRPAYADALLAKLPMLLKRLDTPRVKSSEK